MKQEARRHAKIILAARDLGIDRCHFLGILGELWGETGARYPAGDIGRASNEEIAAYIDYSGDPDALIAVLVKRRLLDEVPPEAGRLIVHDWHEHCEDWVRRKLRDRKLTFANGKPPHTPRQPHESPQNPEESRGVPNIPKVPLARVPKPLPKPNTPLPPSGVNGGGRQPRAETWPDPFEEGSEHPPPDWASYSEAVQHFVGRTINDSEWADVRENLERYQAGGVCPSPEGFFKLAEDARKDFRTEKGEWPKYVKPLVTSLAALVATRREELGT